MPLGRARNFRIAGFEAIQMELHETSPV